MYSPLNAAREFNSKPRKKLKRNHTTFMFSTADTTQLELRTLILQTQDPRDIRDT